MKELNAVNGEEPDMPSKSGIGSRSMGEGGQKYACVKGIARGEHNNQSGLQAS